MKRTIRVLLISFILIAVLLLPSCDFGTTYLASVSPKVTAYRCDENGELAHPVQLARGSEVDKTGKTAELDGEEMTEIRIPEGIKDDEDRLFYVSADNLTKDETDIVRETEIFVRTAATLYENEDGPEIASYAPKGTRLEILEAGELQEDGTIDIYKVKYEDKAGQSGEGYIYGKYVVGTQEEADAHYNKNGEYNKASKAEFRYDLHGGHAKNMDYYPVEKPHFEDNELCTNARTMYINTEAAVHPDEYVKLIKETDCNAVVIDIKDGPLTYKSEVAKEVSPYSYKKAYTSIENFKKGVDAYKETGVYTIGRIVVFNDTRYAKDHPEDCIVSDGQTKWPSAYSRDVWEYNVRIALEAIDLFGFDEIQFDYVRFPEASYEMSTSKKTDFRNTYGEEKGQAIQGFCYYACDQIHKAGAYVSVDVFGECSYAYCTAYGQYWPAISNVVDAISSMPYSDHHGDVDTWTEPYKTLNYWARTTMKRQSEIPTPAIDRTWITGYNTPYWNPTVSYNEEKMKEQIKALTDAGLKGGFIPWNVLSDIGKYRQYKAIWNE